MVDYIPRHKALSARHTRLSVTVHQALQADHASQPQVCLAMYLIGRIRRTKVVCHRGRTGYRHRPVRWSVNVDAPRRDPREEPHAVARTSGSVQRPRGNPGPATRLGNNREYRPSAGWNEAVGDILNRWKKQVRYLQHGDVAIDNNLVANQMGAIV